MSDFQTIDLKSWRKRYNLSQEKFVELSGLGLSTVIRIEAGAHKIQDRTLLKLNTAIRQIEAELMKGMASTKLDKGNPSMIHPASIETSTAISPTDLTLPSNLELELINRVLRMTPKEKLKLIISWIGE